MKISAIAVLILRWPDGRHKLHFLEVKKEGESRERRNMKKSETLTLQQTKSQAVQMNMTKWHGGRCELESPWTAQEVNSASVFLFFFPILFSSLSSLSPLSPLSLSLSFSKVWSSLLRKDKYQLTRYSEEKKAPHCNKASAVPCLRLHAT